MPPAGWPSSAGRLPFVSRLPFAARLPSAGGTALLWATALYWSDAGGGKIVPERYVRPCEVRRSPETGWGRRRQRAIARPSGRSALPAGASRTVRAGVDRRVRASRQASRFGRWRADVSAETLGQGSGLLAPGGRPGRRQKDVSAETPGRASAAVALRGVRASAAVGRMVAAGAAHVSAETSVAATPRRWPSAPAPGATKIAAGEVLAPGSETFPRRRP